MKYLLALLMFLPGLVLAQIPHTDLSNSLAIAETDIPLAEAFVGRMKNDKGCEFAVSVTKEAETGFFAKMLDHHRYYLQVDTATCTDDSGKRISMKMKDRRRLLERPIKSGEEILIPFGIAEYLEYLTQYAQTIKSEEGK